jgi:hypothetical protein
MAIIWVGTGRFSAYISPVQDYIDRVVAADVAAGNTLGLEVGVRNAYDVYIRDSINVGDLGTSGGVLSQANSIIKASCIMAGARTLAGALVPLVGAAPTNFNFVAGDYDRKTGLTGSAINNTKYLNANRNNDAEASQNSKHYSLYVSSFPIIPDGATQSCPLIAAFGTTGGASYSQIVVSASSANQLPNQILVRSNSTSTSSQSITPATGFIGTSRASSSTVTLRNNNTNTSISQASAAPASESTLLFQRSLNPGALTAGRLAFYSIGESLDLALLDARVTALINAIAAAIP